MSDQEVKEAAPNKRRFLSPLWEITDVDVIMHRGPCLVHSIVLSSDGTAEADARVYDGASADSKKFVQAYCVDEAQQQLQFSPPLSFRNGIFVDVGTNVAQLLVHYTPLSQ